jgi:hypothetical protein
MDVMDDRDRNHNRRTCHANQEHGNQYMRDGADDQVKHDSNCMPVCECTVQRQTGAEC